MGLNGECAAEPRRRRGLEAALLLAAAVVFGEVCSLPLELPFREQSRPRIFEDVQQRLRGGWIDRVDHTDHAIYIRRGVCQLWPSARRTSAKVRKPRQNIVMTGFPC